MKENRKLLWEQLCENAGGIAVLLCLSFVMSVFSLTVPWFMQYFTDRIVLLGRWENVWRVIALFGIVTLIRFLVDLLYEKLLAFLTYQKIGLALRRRVKENLLYLDGQYFYKKEHRLAETDVESILLGDVDAFKNVLMQTVKFFTEVLKLLLYVGVLFWYSVPVGLLVCLRIPLYYLLGHVFSAPLADKNEAGRACQSELVQKVKQIFASLAAIKTLQIEETVSGDVDAALISYSKNQEKVSLLNASYQEVNMAVNTVFNVLVLVLCGKAVLAGDMTLGSMMLISNVQSRTTMPLFFFNSYYLQYKSCFPGISRLVRFLERKTETPVLLPPGECGFERIRLENVSYSYEEGRPALAHMDLEIAAGEKILLTGDNMSGKSTLLKVLAGLIEADEGTIRVDGRPVTAAWLRNYATLFLQEQENYAYFGKKGSGGEVQMENLALMEGTESPLILLDEADASINERRVDEVYRFLKSDKTVILVTHRRLEDITKAYPDVRVVAMGQRG